MPQRVMPGNKAQLQPFCALLQYVGVVLSVPSRLSPVFAVAGAATLIICAALLFFCIRDRRRYKTEKIVLKKE